MKLSSFALFLLTLAPLVLMGCQSADSSDTSANQATDDHAEELAQQYIIVDGHIDVPYRLLDFEENIADSTFGGDFDYPRAKAGGLDAPFMSIYLPVELQDDPGASKARAEELINLVEGIAEEHPDKFEVATSPDDGISSSSIVPFRAVFESRLESLHDTANNNRKVHIK